MEMLSGPYDQLFSSYVQISCKNGAQFLNFDNEFEFGDLENSPTNVSSNSNGFDKMDEKRPYYSKGIFDQFPCFQNFGENILLKMEPRATKNGPTSI